MGLTRQPRPLGFPPPATILRHLPQPVSWRGKGGSISGSPFPAKNRSPHSSQRFKTTGGFRQGGGDPSPTLSDSSVTVADTPRTFTMPRYWQPLRRSRYLTRTATITAWSCWRLLKVESRGPSAETPCVASRSWISFKGLNLSSASARRCYRFLLRRPRIFLTRNVVIQIKATRTAMILIIRKNPINSMNKLLILEKSPWSRPQG